MMFLIKFQLGYLLDFSYFVNSVGSSNNEDVVKVLEDNRLTPN